MTPTALAISVCPCFIREVYYFLVVGVDCACWSVYYCFLRVMIVLVGQLYQDRGVSGVQGWAVGFSEHVTSVDMKIGPGILGSLAVWHNLEAAEDFKCPLSSALHLH